MQTGQSSSSVKLKVPSRAYKFIPVEVTFDPSEPVGMYVNVDGVKDPSLAEMARRGGFLSICGRIWQQSASSAGISNPLRSNLTDIFEQMSA